MIIASYQRRKKKHLCHTGTKPVAAYPTPQAIQSSPPFKKKDKREKIKKA
jgi:hypothetical protein